VGATNFSKGHLGGLKMVESNMTIISDGQVCLSDEDKEAIANRVVEKFEQTTEVTSSSLARGYGKAFLIGLQDIESLKNKVGQELSTVKVISNVFNATVRFSNGRSSNHNAWEEFAKFDSSRSDYINEIILKFVMLIEHASSQKPEKYTLEIKFRTDIQDAEYLIAQVLSNGEGPHNLAISVEYRDYIIGKNLFALLEGWVSSLGEVDKSWYSPVLLRFATSSWTNRLSLFIAEISLVSFALFLGGGWDFGSPVSIVKFVAISLAAYSVTKVILATIREYFERQVKKLTLISAIQITNGDKNRLEKYRMNNLRNVSAALASAFVMLMGIPLNIFSAWLARLWFGI
jgi:hypothetical protein